MKYLFTLALLAVAIHSAAAAKPELEKINVGYFKGVPFLVPVIIKEMKWDKEAGLDFNLQYFNGPPLVNQAFAAGTVDVMYNNSCSVFPLPDHGVAIQILSATTKNSFSVIARPPLLAAATDKTAKPGEAIKQFAAQQKRKVKIGIVAKGAITDVLIHLWMEKEPKDVVDSIEIVNAGAFDQLQQLIVSGALDAACVPEPLFTIARTQDASWQVLITPDDLLADHLSGVLVAHQAYVDSHPVVVKKLIELQMRAIQFMRENPKKAAECIARQPSEGLVNAAIWEQAIRVAEPTFSTDLLPELASAKVMSDYMHKNGYLSAELDLSKIFALKTYSEVSWSNKK